MQMVAWSKAHSIRVEESVFIKTMTQSSSRIIESCTSDWSAGGIYSVGSSLELNNVSILIILPVISVEESDLMITMLRER